LAGLLTNYLILLSYLFYITTKNRVHIIVLIIAFLSTLLTSRINILLLTVTFLVIIIINRTYKAKIISLFIPIIVIFSSFFSIFIWIVSTSIFPELRTILLQNDAILSFSIQIRQTYSLSDFFEITEQHFFLNFNQPIQVLFGFGFDPVYSDTGIIRIITSIGIVGFIVVLFYNFSIYSYIKRLSKLSFGQSKIYFLVTLASFMYMIVSNLKLQFFFTTGIFELLTIFIIALEVDFEKSRGQKNYD
jgi:hypothetical protein